VNPTTISLLLDLNRQFYQTFAIPFSATRHRLQPGVLRILTWDVAMVSWRVS
jgi:hypothetical protein